MESPKEYFDREYDGNHIANVVDLFDLKSLYGLISEYTDYAIKYSKPIIENELKSEIKEWLKGEGYDGLSERV